MGGSNGASSVNNNFVEPGAYVCPTGSTFGSNCFETPFQFSGHKTVYTIGPFIGYRWMIGKGPYPGATVFGIEGDWSFKNAETSLNQSSSTLIALTGSNVLRTDQFSGSVKQKSDFSIRARLGVLVTPWSLLYVTGGVAFEEISGSFAYAGSLCPSTSSSSCTSSSSIGTATTAVNWSDTRLGSTVGAGWETEIAPGWKARAEYRYTDFGTYTKTFALNTSCSGGCSSPSSSVSIDLKDHSTRSVSVWPLIFSLERHLTDAKHYFVLVDFRAAIICALRRVRVAVAWANDLAAGAGPQAPLQFTRFCESRRTGS